MPIEAKPNKEEFSPFGGKLKKSKLPDGTS